MVNIANCSTFFVHRTNLITGTSNYSYIWDESFFHLLLPGNMGVSEQTIVSRLLMPFVLLHERAR